MTGNRMAGRRRWAAVAAGAGALAVGLAVALTAGGGSSGASAGTSGAAGMGGKTVAAGGSCGVTRTAAGVPVTIKVTRGPADCATALAVEREYATLIRKGAVPGTGGGAPVTVHGWTCQGYATPQVLRTGRASRCYTATAEVAAVLAVPSSGD